MAKYRWTEMYEVRDVYEINIDEAELQDWKAKMNYSHRPDADIMDVYIHDWVLGNGYTDNMTNVNMIITGEQISDTNFDCEEIK